jgi:hypothetical protein
MRVTASLLEEGTAKALWATIWADQMEELGLSSHLSGTEITDVMPEVPNEARALAEKFLAEVEKLNSKKLDDDEELGWYLAMEAMGHRVSWNDDHEEHGLQLPHLDNNELADAADSAVRDEYDRELSNTFDAEYTVAKRIHAQLDKGAKMANDKKRIEAKEESSAKRIEAAAFAFPNLFSSDAEKWIKMQIQVQAASLINYISATPEQAAAAVEQAAADVTREITTAVPMEVKRVFESEKANIIDNIVVNKEQPMGVAPVPAPIAASKRVTADDFMQPDIQKGEWVEIDGPQGGESVSAEYVDMAEVAALIEQLEAGNQVDLKNTSLKDFVQNDKAFSINVVTGYGARLSAPGYLDSTEWTVFDTEDEAKAFLKEMYGDEEVDEEVDEDVDAA